MTLVSVLSLLYFSSKNIWQPEIFSEGIVCNNYRWIGFVDITDSEKIAVFWSKRGPVHLRVQLGNHFLPFLAFSPK